MSGHKHIANPRGAHGSDRNQEIHLKTVYNNGTSPLAVGRTVVFDESAAEAYDGIAVIAGAATDDKLAAGLVYGTAIPAADYGQVIVEGPFGSAIVDGTTDVAAGDLLGVLAEDGTDDGMLAKTTTVGASIARAMQAVTTAGAQTGIRVIVGRG